MTSKEARPLTRAECSISTRCHCPVCASSRAGVTDRKMARMFNVSRQQVRKLRRQHAHEAEAEAEALYVRCWSGKLSQAQLEDELAALARCRELDRKENPNAFQVHGTTPEDGPTREAGQASEGDGPNLDGPHATHPRPT